MFDAYIIAFTFLSYYVEFEYYSFHILIYRAALVQTEAAQDQPNVIAHVILVNVHRMQKIFGKNNVPSMTTLHSRENDTNGFLTWKHQGNVN